MTKLLLLAAFLAVPLHAEVAAQPKGGPSCVCDNGGFVAKSDKAKAVEEYWQARRKLKISTVINGTGVLFGTLFGNPNTVAGAAQDHERIRSEMFAAKAKAESLGALKVTGDDLDGGTIEIDLKKGVDYVIEP